VPLKSDTILDGRYQLIEVLDEGGMGVVYRASQLSLNREVAIKTLRPSTGRAEYMARRFEREVELASRLHHPNVVQLYDYGRGDDGEFFLVMEFLRGSSLKRVIGERGGLRVGRAGELMLQILDALGAAHDADIVHRDLKPSNVFVTSAARRAEVVKLLDFGVAKSLQPGEDELTDPNMVVGTTSYIAPELLRGHSATAAADVYAAGLVFLEMLTGVKVVRGKSTSEKLFKHLNTPVEVPSAIAQTSLADVIYRAVAKEPDERYPNAAKMFDAFGDALDDMDPDLQVSADADGDLSSDERARIETFERTALTRLPDEQKSHEPADVSMDDLRAIPTVIMDPNAARWNQAEERTDTGFILEERTGPGARDESTWTPKHSSGRRWTPWLLAAAVLIACAAIVIISTSDEPGGNPLDSSDQNRSSTEPDESASRASLRNEKATSAAVERAEESTDRALVRARRQLRHSTNPPQVDDQRAPARSNRDSNTPKKSHDTKPAKLADEVVKFE
jgi:serine/threonine protein kinase